MSKFGWDDDTQENENSVAVFDTVTKMLDETKNAPSGENKIDPSSVFDLPKEVMNLEATVDNNIQTHQDRQDKLETSLETLHGILAHINSLDGRVSREMRNALVETIPEVSLESASAYTNIPSYMQAEYTVDTIKQEILKQRIQLLRNEVNEGKDTIYLILGRVKDVDAPAKDTVLNRLNSELQSVYGRESKLKMRISLYQEAILKLTALFLDEPKNLARSMYAHLKDEEKLKNIESEIAAIKQADGFAEDVFDFNKALEYTVEILFRKFKQEGMEYDNVSDIITKNLNGEYVTPFNYLSVLASDDIPYAFMNVSIFRNGENFFNDKMDLVGEAIQDAYNDTLEHLNEPGFAKQMNMSRSVNVLMERAHGFFTERNGVREENALDEFEIALRTPKSEPKEKNAVLKRLLHAYLNIEENMYVASSRMIQFVRSVDLYFDWYLNILSNAAEDLVDVKQTNESLEALESILQAARVVICETAKDGILMAKTYVKYWALYQASKLGLSEVFAQLAKLNKITVGVEYSGDLVVGVRVAAEYANEFSRYLKEST